MSKPAGTVEVRVADLQAQINVPELNLLSQTRVGEGKTEGLKIEMDQNGLWLSKAGVRAFVPMTNVKVAVLK